MPRRPRAFEAGALYHVNAKGNNSEAIVRDDVDRIDFIRTLARVAATQGWRIHAYCVMTNHYHLVVESPDQGLSRGMQQLNCGFARQMNKRYGRSGHLFRQRFHSVAILTTEHLMTACRYVVLNPVRAGLRSAPEDWPWSSYRACIDLDLAPSFLAVGDLLRLFGSTPADARAAYRRYVESDQARASDTLPSA